MDRACIVGGEEGLDELAASSSNAIWQSSNEGMGYDREEAKDRADHNEYVVTETDDHISEMSQTFLIEHTKNHITERTNEDSSLS